MASSDLIYLYDSTYWIGSNWLIQTVEETGTLLLPKGLFLEFEYRDRLVVSFEFKESGISKLSILSEEDYKNLFYSVSLKLSRLYDLSLKGTNFLDNGFKFDRRDFDNLLDKTEF